MILIVRKEAAVKAVTYSGVVRDKDGPVIGAVIQVEGTPTAATSGLGGTFSVVAEKGDVLVVNMLGYKDVRFPRRPDGRACNHPFR